MRLFTRSFLIGLLFVAVLLGGCDLKRGSEAPVTRERFMMDTLCRITVYHQTESEGEALLDEAFRRVEEIDRELNNQDPEGLSVRLSEAPAGSSVQLSESTAALLRRMLKLSEETSGRYDPTVSPLVALYEFYRPADSPETEREESFRVPSVKEIKEARRQVGYRHLHLEGKTLRLDRAGILLDFGSIGKGRALFEAASVLKEKRVSSALLDFGGNVAVVGESPRGGAWRIGIQNPRGEGIVGVILVKDAAVSTSGDYQRCFIKAGRRYHHILDALTGQPVEGLASVVVVHPSAAEADALSTAAFVMGPERALSFIEQNGGFGIVIREDDKGRLIARASPRLAWEPESILKVDQAE